MLRRHNRRPAQTAVGDSTVTPTARDTAISFCRLCLESSMCAGLIYLSVRSVMKVAIADWLLADRNRMTGLVR